MACAMDIAHSFRHRGGHFHVVLLHAERDMATVRGLHLTHPEIVKVLLLDNSERDTVLNAFAPESAAFQFLRGVPAPVVQVHSLCS